MNQPATHNMAETNPERFAQVSLLGDCMADQLQTLPMTLAIEVLLYTVVRMFMDAKLNPGITKVEAFDHYMAAARHTLERNLELNAQEQANGVR